MTEATTVAPPRAAQVGELAGKFLTFFLGDEEYGLPILHVQEIISVIPATPMPRTPAHIVGVVNLRGKVIPIVNLRERFGLPEVEHGSKTCIIVVYVHDRATGIVVDHVSEVVDIQADAIESIGGLGSDLQTEFLLGVANCEDGLKILLAIENVLPREDGETAGT